MAKNMKEKAARIAETKDRRPRAVAKHVRISPYKVRIVLDLIRGKDLREAVAILENTPKSASEPVRKLLNSAAANAAQERTIPRMPRGYLQLLPNQRHLLR